MKLSPPDPFATLDDYLVKFSPSMAQRIDRSLRPLFDPGVDSVSDEVAALVQSDIPPYPAQAACTEALIRLFRHSSEAILNGEMGTGKTVIAGHVARVLAHDLDRPIRVVITAPNQLVKKWRRHCERLIPGCTARIVTSWDQLNSLVASRTVTTKQIDQDGVGTSRSAMVRSLPPTRTEVYILPRDRGKLGYAWRPAVVAKPRHNIKTDVTGRKVRVVSTETLTCPRCGAEQVDDEGLPLMFSDLVTAAGKPKRKLTCSGEGCDEPLWQAHNGTRGSFTHRLSPMPGISPRKVAPGSHLRRLGVRFDLYIADEMHELKGAGTLQGQMFADLCIACDRVLMLTGTLVGGYADNLLHILWRTIPHRLAADGLTHDAAGFEEYTKLYGVIRSTKRYVAENEFTSVNDLVRGRGKKTGSRTKSLPGISPLLFTNFLLDRTVFIRLAEMHAHLPPFKERLWRIPMDPAQDAALHLMQEEFADHRSWHKPCRGMSAARACFLRWPDKPWIDSYTPRCLDMETGERHDLFTVPSLPKREYPKERRVRRLVRRNMLRGRKTWVFTELAGVDGEPAWDYMEYLAEYLGKHGIRAEILRSQAQGGPKPENREEWIEKHAPNVDVMISNASLVQTGLDLFDFPSIIFAYCGENTYTLRQASRRSWRLGQTEDCEVDYLVYFGRASRSVQDAAMSLMAAKMDASLAIEGDFSSDGLAAMSGGEDVSSKLAKFIAGQLDDIDPSATAFDRYRKRLEKTLANVATDVRTTPSPVAPEAPVQMVMDEYAAAAIKGLESMGIDVPVAEPEPAPAPKKPEATKKQEPRKPARDRKAVTQRRSLSDRRRVRLLALSSAIGQPPDESDGNLHRFGDTWYHLIAKRRETVRARNFEATATSKPDAMIAFVELADEAGPVTGSRTVRVDGSEYSVSAMRVADYMNGERVPTALEV